MESWSGREFSFFPNFPSVYSFAEHSSFPHSLIQFLTHSFILPTFIEHLLCPSSGLSTLRDAVWMPNDCLVPLFYSFSISPTQISTISGAPALEPSFSPLHAHFVIVLLMTTSCFLYPPPTNPTPIKFLILFFPLHFHNHSSVPAPGTSVPRSSHSKLPIIPIPWHLDI